jgi:hypothetical protein
MASDLCATGARQCKNRAGEPIDFEGRRRSRDAVNLARVPADDPADQPDPTHPMCGQSRG